MPYIRYRRIRLLGVLFILLVVMALGRLAFLQLVVGKELSRQAWSGRADFVALEDFSRGEIVDRFGRSLTDTVATPGVIVFPVLLSDPERAASELANILNQPFLELSHKLQNGRLALVLKKGLTDQEVKLIQQLQMDGICVLPVKERYGPEALAEHLIGYAAAKDLIGVKGIERIYDQDLYFKGQTEGVFVLKDALNRPFNAKEIRRRDPASTPELFQRRKVVLTIDRDIQGAVEAVMDQRIARGAVVVMDLANREVLAMASRPGFDQNKVASYLGESREVGVFCNRALAYYYPGSIFKIVVTAAALNEGLVDFNETFFCSGSFIVTEDLAISCWEKDGHGYLTLPRAFALSCNPVFLEIGQRLGGPLLQKYVAAFGFTEAHLLGYPLPEGPAIAIPSYPGALANASLGQKGVKLTPLMVASLLATLVNAGEYCPPQIVKQIEDQQGQLLRKIESGVARRVVTPGTAKKMELLLGEVTKTGTGREAWVLKGGSAGKTGSAQSGQLNAAGEEIINAWFAGYAPLKQPRLAVVVLVEAGGSGGHNAAPIFREIMEKLIILTAG